MYDMQTQLFKGVLDGWLEREPLILVAFIYAPISCVPKTGSGFFGPLTRGIGVSKTWVGQGQLLMLCHARATTIKCEEDNRRARAQCLTRSN